MVPSTSRGELGLVLQESVDQLEASQCRALSLKCCCLRGRATPASCLAKLNFSAEFDLPWTSQSAHLSRHAPGGQMLD
jgi:hypothetical protein